MEENTFLVTYIDSEFSEEGERAIDECCREEMEKADRVEISVAYFGHKTLQEIDRLVEEGKIKYICVILGMYFFIGFREAMYKLVIKIHTKWQEMGAGEIRLVDYFPHHGKLYCFYKNDHLFSAIIGSPNLSFLTKNNKREKPRQCEIGQLVHEYSWLLNYHKHIKKLGSDKFSKNMTFLEQYKSVVITMETNKKGEITKKLKLLTPKITREMINLEELKQLEQSEALRTITIPLIVPTEQEIIDNSDLDLSFSPLNACYSKPIINEKTGERQSWRDVKLTIEGEDNLPSKKDWFYLMTDNGFLYKACFSGRGKRVKWLNTFKDKNVIGDWIKNRFVECELIEEFWYPDEDKKKSGIITKEVLEDYGGDKIYLKKTNQTRKDEKGNDRDVWFISFPFLLWSEIEKLANK